MANKITIEVEVDPSGQGARGLQKIKIDVAGIERGAGGASTGVGSLSSALSAIAVPTSLGAIAGALVKIGVDGVQAANAGANSLRVLKSDAQTAGVSFEEARKNAEKFGRDTAQSTTQAELSYARFLRVVKGAGELDNLKDLTKNFTNLTAAYGLTATEIETLTQQLLSGQDEALNRLGIADPSQLYIKYAASVGKTVEALTEEEKVRARLLAVNEKGEQFAGAAEQRLASEAGQWATLSANIANASRSLGEFLNKRTLVGQIPTVLNNAGTNPGARAGLVGALAPGLTLETRAALLREGLIDSAVRRQREADARAKSEQFRQEAENEANAFRREADLASRRQKIALNPNAEFDNFENLIASRGEKAAEELRASFVAQYEKLFKDKRLDLATVVFAEKQFRNIKGILSPEKAAEIEDNLSNLLDRYGKTALSYLKSTRDAADALFSGLADKYAGGNNPFVKILADADENARKLTKTFGVLGDATVKELQRVEDAYTRQRTLALQLDADLKASSLRREANQLQNFSGLSATQSRRLDELEARISAAVSVPDLEATAEAIRRGAVGSVQVSAAEVLQRQFAANRGRDFSNLTEEEKFLAIRGRDKEIERTDARRRFFIDSGLNVRTEDVQRRQLENLRRLQGFAEGDRGKFGEKTEEAVAQAIVDLFRNMSPELQAKIATGGEGLFTRQTVAGAFTTTADAANRRIAEEIEKARVADRAVAAVREDIQTIENARKLGLSSREADARLLATTGELSPAEMTADIRQARIDVLRREADRQANLQAEGIAATEKAREATDRLTGAVDGLAKELKNPENRRLLIDINNRAKADVRDELYGSVLPGGSR